MDQNLSPCPVCEYPSKCEDKIYNEINDFIRVVKCLRCGDFMILLTTATDVSSFLTSEDMRLKASSRIREITNRSYILDNDELKRLSNVNKPSVDERASNLLLTIAEHSPDIGPFINKDVIEQSLTKFPKIDVVDFENSLMKLIILMMSKSWSKNRKEIDYLIFDYHVNGSKHLLETSDKMLTITPGGWTYIEELKTKTIESNMGFIAMKFQNKLIEYSKNWFEIAIQEAGYTPKVMYSHEHTDIIDNEMKALIRRSKFLVCDLTENSRGAYYEAGFAHGLGRQVIFLCESKFFHKKEHKLGPESDGVHFDTNHYPFIEWEYKNGEALKNKLKNWIEATIGTGLNSINS